MKRFLRNYFYKLNIDKGEDIFEYGFEDFNVEDYLIYLYNNDFIDENLYNELIEEDAELFQVIEEVSDDYEYCCEVFAGYLLVTFDEDKIVDVLVAAAY